jgi:phage tail sheath protein FI
MVNYRSPGVYVEEVEAGSRPIEGVGTAVAAFLGVAADGPFNTPLRIANWGQYVKEFGGWVEGAYLPLSVFNFFNNGGGACYVIRLGANGASGSSRPAAELTSSSKAGVGVYRIEARQGGSRAEGLSVEVTHDGGGSSRGSGGSGGDGGGGSTDGGGDSFSVTVKQGGQAVESFQNLTTRRGKRNVATVINEESRLVKVEETGSATPAERLPSAGEVVLAGAGPVLSRLATDDYLGDAAARSGLGGLEAIDDVTMIAAPDLMATYEQGHIDLESVQAVQQGLIDHCQNMKDRMVILDSPPGLSAQQVREWRREKARYDSRFATLYWPWVKVFDPSSQTNRLVPPSGLMAGIWGRNDDTRGVHKAPANEVVAGALDVEINITRAEHDALNPEGINVIRAFPGRGIRVWGARTLSSDPAWRYVNVRRLFNFIESSILNGTQWAVFEPNDLDLWQRLSRTVSAFLLGLWRNGALFGATPGEAFYVKCDAETNPPDVVDAGQVVVEVGVAPVKPAEFVIFRIAQYASGGGLEE